MAADAGPVNALAHDGQPELAATPWLTWEDSAMFDVDLAEVLTLFLVVVVVIGVIAVGVRIGSRSPSD